MKNFVTDKPQRPFAYFKYTVSNGNVSTAGAGSRGRYAALCCSFTSRNRSCHVANTRAERVKYSRLATETQEEPARARRNAKIGRVYNDILPIDVKYVDISRSLYRN